jgi:hypothetical protein
MTAFPQPSIRSAAAERMARSRQRRRDGKRCITIELFEREIDGLVARGMLDPAARNSVPAIRKALYGFLDRTMKA